MIEKLFVYSPAVFLWAAVILKLRSHRCTMEPLNPAQRDLLLTLSVLGVASVIVLPPVHLAIDVATGVPNLARLIANALAVAACGTAQILLVRLTEPEDRVEIVIRRYRVLLVIALVLLVGFFVAASPRDEALDFTPRFAAQPFILEYKLVFLSCFGLALANFSRLAWRYWRIAPHPSLKLGLLVITVGALLGVLYALHDGYFIVGRRLGLYYPFASPLPITQGLLFSSAALIAAGSVLPEWGDRVGVPSLYRWLSNYRSLRRLYPLWYALCAATPEVALVPPKSRLRDALAVRDLGFRLYRRVIEIRDGALAVRPYRALCVERLARELCEREGLSAEEAEPLVEAVCRAAAARAKPAGHRVDAESSASPSHVLGGSDLESEIVILERVAHHFEHSPAVRQVLVRLEAKPNGEIAVAPSQTERAAGP